MRDGLSMHDCSEMVVACFTFAIILASKSQLEDNVLNSLTEAVSDALTVETVDAGLVCISALMQQKSDQSLSRRVVGRLARVDSVEKRLQVLEQDYHVEGFILAMIQSALLNQRSKGRKERLNLVERLLFADLLEPVQTKPTIALLLKSYNGEGGDPSSTSAGDPGLILLRRLHDSDKFSAQVATGLKEAGLTSTFVGASLLNTIENAETVSSDVDEVSVDSVSQDDLQTRLSLALELVPQRTVDEHSFLSQKSSHLFNPLLEAFTLASQGNKGMRLFLDLALWRTSTKLDEPLFVSFFIRVASGPYSLQMRYAALTSIRDWLLKVGDFDSQAILPYILPQLADPAQRIRKVAAEIVLAQDHALPSASLDGEIAKKWDVFGLHGIRKNDGPPIVLHSKDFSKILQRAVIPALEECVLDSTQIKRATESALKPSSSSKRINDSEVAIELKSTLEKVISIDHSTTHQHTALFCQARSSRSPRKYQECRSNAEAERTDAAAHRLG
ncbi:hypothetical protein HC762_00460 [bacterium]|nr:hypothetical protein [bacterium]